MADLVASLVASNRVMVFSKSYCPYCSKAKRALNSVGLSAFGLLELDSHPRADEVRRRARAHFVAARADSAPSARAQTPSSRARAPGAAVRAAVLMRLDRAPLRRTVAVLVALPLSRACRCKTRC
jgi:glutaredoxin